MTSRTGAKSVTTDARSKGGEARLRVKQISPHVDGCNALAEVERGDWSNPLFMPMEEVEHRDSIGRPYRGSRRWAVVICNSTSCYGRWVVSMDSIEDAVYRAAVDEARGRD